MEKIVSRENMLSAWKRVQQNQGSAGVDGRTIEQTGKYLKTHWEKIKRFLLEGSYVPREVRKVRIPKASGGIRELGIPTVQDRMIQQAILQVLQPILDPTFHPQSYGFRPGRSAHQAIRQVQSFIGEGREYCVDVDIEKFFDRVNHDLLMDRVRKRIKDERLIRIIRRFLQAGMMDEGVSVAREEGTPQGGPLSPLLSNLMLDEMDWELEKRGLRFVRYADDCNVYVKSKRAAERAYRTINRCLRQLKLRVNENKSYVGKALGTRRKFLGYAMSKAPDGRIRPRASNASVVRFQAQIRRLTRRTLGENIQEMTKKRLNPYIRGWRNYFALADEPRVFPQLDSWIRRRLRAIQLKQWKQSRTCTRELASRGLPYEDARRMGAAMRSWWRASRCPAMHQVFGNEYYRTLGLEGLST